MLRAPANLAFSLVELLVVIGIASLLLVVSIAAFGNIAQATGLTRGGR